MVLNLAVSVVFTAAGAGRRAQGSTGVLKTSGLPTWIDSRECLRAAGHKRADS